MSLVDNFSHLIQKRHIFSPNECRMSQLQLGIRLKYSKRYLIGTVSQFPKQPLRVLDRSQSIVLTDKQVNWDVDVTNVVSRRILSPITS
jgi:hypothetical protein